MSFLRRSGMSALLYNAGQCGRARRILALRYPKISFVHCFAHDINNLVKAVLKTVFKQISADAAGVASYLNTSTSKWLVRAVKAMHKRYGTSFAIFTLCETRWNSMQSCFASLLRARGALEDLAFSYRNSRELTDKLRVLGDHEFWTKLETAEKIVRPLCTASFCLQRNENTVADVVVSFIEIYRGFASTDMSDSLTGLVEARWYACEQPLFILVFFLHPEYVVPARQLPPTVLTELDDVCQIAQYYYRRFVSNDDSGLRGEMFKWIQGDYTTSRCVDFDKDAVATFWLYEKKSQQNRKLPVLALTILSIAVNTATCERLFSELALILTPKWNRMSIEKTTKHQIMRQYVREKNCREKIMPTSSKKLLRTIDPRERPCIATPQNSARTTPARTTPSNPTPAPARTPIRESQSAFATPDRHVQDQLQSTPLARVLFSEQQEIGAVAARSMGLRESSAPMCRTHAAIGPASPDPPTASNSTAAICRQTLLENEAVDTLTAELDTVALSDQQLDEYLEHFDWEEIGEYGDEDTVDMWSNILNTPNTPSGPSNTDGSGAHAESDTSAGDGTSNSGVDPNESVTGEDDTTTSNAGNDSPFTTARLGSYEDPIPAASRQPYPLENDPTFPQEKTLTGIRARKTSLASLINEQ